MPVKTVLVVDDNAMNLELAGNVLEAAGFAVFTAELAQVGIEIARANVPDIILMDINMPGMDGYEAVRALKADARTRDIPTVALTAFAMASDAERAASAGFDGYISKPIQTRTFAELVRKLIHGRS